MPRVGFEPTIAAGERPKTYALVRAATGTGDTAKLITMYFYWLILQKRNFSQAQCKLPEDGPGGPKHIGTNIRYFNVNFNISYV